MGSSEPSASPTPELSRPRLSVALLPRQVLYQLILLLRDPMGSFISVVIPLMLLVALDLVTPEMTLSSLGGIHIAQFLTPAMASFAVLNAGFVNIVIGMTLAREQGMLKRLRPTPLPTWVYLAGRLVAAAIVALLATAVVLLVGVVFLHAHVATSSLLPLLGVFSIGLVAACATGMAASALVPSPDAALPFAYAVLLPVAFISQIFFPAPSEATWLHHLANALPIAPFTSAMQSTFDGRTTGCTEAQFVVLILWAVGGFLFTLATYQWRPGNRRQKRHRALKRQR